MRSSRLGLSTAPKWKENELFCSVCGWPQTFSVLEWKSVLNGKSRVPAYRALRSVLLQSLRKTTASLSGRTRKKPIPLSRRWSKMHVGRSFGYENVRHREVQFVSILSKKVETKSILVVEKVRRISSDPRCLPKYANVSNIMHLYHVVLSACLMHTFHTYIRRQPRIPDTLQKVTKATMANE